MGHSFEKAVYFGSSEADEQLDTLFWEFCMIISSYPCWVRDDLGTLCGDSWGSTHGMGHIRKRRRKKPRKSEILIHPVSGG